MAFLYGQLDHFILDMIMHPLIYYMTENMPKENLLEPHVINNDTSFNTGLPCGKGQTLKYVKKYIKK